MITALLVVVIVLLVLVLLLLAGVIRRLQVHEAMLQGTVTPGGGEPSPLTLRPSFAVPEFSVPTTDGRVVDQDVLLAEPGPNGDVHVVFFSTECDHCRQVVGELGAALRAEPERARGVFVVVFDDAEDAGLFRRELDGVVRTAIRPTGDELIQKFGVSALPRVHTFREDGALRSVTTTLDEVAPSRAVSRA
jgi:hypothetical protein